MNFKKKVSWVSNFTGWTLPTETQKIWGGSQKISRFLFHHLPNHKMANVQFDRSSIAQKKQQHKASALQRWKDELTLLVCIVGIYVVYIYYAVLQERM
jgi:hypothetical protein